MEKIIDQLIDSIKFQTQAFLLDAGEFYPFGSSIDFSGDVVPLSAYIESEDDHPPSSEVFDLLEKSILFDLLMDKLKVAAIGTDIFIHDSVGRTFDALEIRIYKQDTDPYKLHFIYKIEEDKVVFLLYDI